MDVVLLVVGGLVGVGGDLVDVDGGGVDLGAADDAGPDRRGGLGDGDEWLHQAVRLVVIRQVVVPQGISFRLHLTVQTL